MHHYRQALLRMRQGDSDRDIAEARIMGRRKAGQWRALAQTHGWLDAQTHSGENIGDTETHVLFVELKHGAPNSGRPTLGPS